MVICGVAILTGSFMLGQMIGEMLGSWLGIDANVGGVGFAMLILIFVHNWMRQRQLFSIEMERGILFWSNMYIPVIVAMASIQNVASALSGGMIAILAGILPTAACFLLIPLISKIK